MSPCCSVGEPDTAMVKSDVHPRLTTASDNPWGDEEPEPGPDRHVPDRWDENPKRRGGRKRKVVRDQRQQTVPGKPVMVTERKVLASTTPLKRSLDLVMPIFVPDPVDGLVCVLKSSQYVVWLSRTGLQAHDIGLYHPGQWGGAMPH